MSDPNSIALRMVDGLKPLALQLGRAGLQALLKAGNVVEARVIAMLAKDMAQLDILGEKVEVSTAQPLKAGTTISVAIHRNGRGLELVIQPDANQPRAAQAPQPAAPGEPVPAPQPQPASLEEWVLTAQAAINEAALSRETAIPREGLASAQQAHGRAIQGAATGFLSQAQLQAQIRSRYDLDETASAIGPGHDASRPAPADAAPRPVAQPTPAPGQHASPSAPAILAPFQLPQMLRPVLMTIAQHDDSEAQQQPGAPAAKRWTVSFSLDAGSIGQVHVTIGLSAAVRVALASDQAQSAFLLRAWLPELKAALEEADLAVDELSVRETGRDDAASSAPVLL